jgi:hypothetical protein
VTVTGRPTVDPGRVGLGVTAVGLLVLVANYVRGQNAWAVVAGALLAGAGGVLVLWAWFRRRRPSS